jgi:hypothetical protein
MSQVDDLRDLSGIGGEDDGVRGAAGDGGVELEGDEVFGRVEDGVRADDPLEVLDGLGREHGCIRVTCSQFSTSVWFERYGPAWASAGGISMPQWGQ